MSDSLAHDTPRGARASGAARERDARAHATDARDPSAPTALGRRAP